MREHLARQAGQIEARHPAASRLRPPDDVVARMRPRFAEFGITRLAEITGLDHVGWPVWAAIRPNAPTLSVSQGKGPKAEAAQASAVMEAVEITAAERVEATRIASAATLTARGALVERLGGLVRRGCALPAEQDLVGWIAGHDLMTGRDMEVPVEAVKLDATDPHRVYWQSSDGLGSGSLLLEAVLHGLCERIERDAGEFWLLRSDRAVAEACVDPYGFACAEVSSQADAIARAGLHLRLFDITSDIGVPVFFATVSPHPDGRESDWNHFDLASGMGCGLDPGQAAAAAVGEALQSRLTTISGARDDFQPGLYRQPIASDLLLYPRCAVSEATGAMRCEPVPIRDALDVLLGRLAAAEVRSVIVVRLHEDQDFAVAKVLVPDLEHPPGARAVPQGPRLLRAMAGRRR